MSIKPNHKDSTEELFSPGLKLSNMKCTNIYITSKSRWDLYRICCPEPLGDHAAVKWMSAVAAVLHS